MVGAIFQLYGYRSGVLFPDAITTFDVVIVNTCMVLSYLSRIAKEEKARQAVVDLLDALNDVMFFLQVNCRRTAFVFSLTIVTNSVWGRDFKMPS